MCFFSRPSGRKYVVLEIAKPTAVERDEAVYRSAYLLLMENVRMELMIATLRPRGFFEGGGVQPSRVSARALYTTESLRQHGVASFAEFKRHTPYQEGWLVLSKLSVHSDDADKAVRMLERAGMDVKRPPTRRSWH